MPDPDHHTVHAIQDMPYLDQLAYRSIVAMYQMVAAIKIVFLMEISHHIAHAIPDTVQQAWLVMQLTTVQL